MQLFFCKIFNRVYDYSKIISTEIRDKILFLSFLLTFLFGFYYYTIPSNVHLFYKCLLGSIFLFISIVFSIDQRLHPKKLDKKWFSLIICFGLLRIISSFFVSLEYLPLALIWCIEFISFFYINAITDNFNKIIYLISKAFNVFLTLYFVLSILFVAFSSGQYTGIMINPNGVGQIVAIGFPLNLILIYKEEDKKNKNRFYYLNLVLCLYFCYLSSSRTGLIALVFLILIKFSMDLFVRKIDLILILKRTGKFILISFMIIICINIINHFSSQIVSDVFTDSIQQETINNSLTNHIQENENPEKSLSKRVLGKDKTGNTLEDYSSGRTGIWKEVLNNMNLLGHPSKEHIITERNGDVGNNAHNTVLQFIYDNGIITGILFLSIQIYAYYKLLYIYCKTKDTKIYFAILIQTSFVITSMFASLNLPFLYLITFIYYSTFILLMLKGNEKYENNRNV